VHTLEIVLLLVLLLALIVDGVLLARRLRPGGARGSVLRAAALLLTVVAVVVIGGFVVVLARSDGGDGATTATIDGSAQLQRLIIDDLQRYYYKPVDAAKLQRIAGTKAIDAMLKTLKDPYTEYMDPKETALQAEHLKGGTYGGIGAILQKKDGQILITQVIDGSPAAAAGLAPGDVIAKVDGRATAGEPVDVVSARVRGKAGTQVRLEIRRTGRATPLLLTLTRRQVKYPLADSRIIDDHGVRVGYVYLSAFATGAGEEVRAALKDLQRRGAQRILLDLRYNGGGWLGEGVNVASDFLQPGRVVVTTQGLHSPKEVFESSGSPATTLPVVVLVNHYTVSASEIVAGALQDWGRATIVGTRTFGKGLVQTPLSLPGGASFKLTTAVYLTPRGTDINHVGIIPTVSAKDDPKTKRDEALQRALRFIATGR
jgi:carboxyl-terminal processing protease